MPLPMLQYRSSRLWCLNRAPITYSKLQTATNNPNISQKMRYSQIVNTPANQRTIKGQNLKQRTIAPLTN
jgi:hypothetical protein